MTQTEDLTVGIRRAGGLVTVTVVGEIDIWTGTRLQHVLDTASADGAHRIDVDFSDVSFCDCSGLTVLLRARRQARERGIAFRLTRVRSPLVRTLLQRTGTADVLAVDDQG
ncbi:STAS domain-containing protein [Streptomyces sp. NPDC096176]|uniref:STAS domain-containing protein n=1 Tax=Streptomyces sp. NPDC096176 TaxID=3366079 RepID=UPI0037F7CECF